MSPALVVNISPGTSGVLSYSPVHSTPFQKSPSVQVQEYDPIRLVQIILGGHLPRSHSFISVKNKV